jgi:flagellar operon protein
MSNYIHPLKQHYTTTLKQGGHIKTREPQEEKPFKQLLQQYTDIGLTKHAEIRMQERNIAINRENWQRISDKMKEANQKGITDALVVMEDVALVVSTKNHKVITALHQTEAKEKIFTNINGTIIL